MAGKPLISDKLAEFLESGLSINVGTRNDRLEPDGAVAWAVHVHDDGAQLTIYMHEEASQAMLKNLRVHPEIAVLCERPTTHRGCQVKGRFVSTRIARTPERRKVEQQVDRFYTELEGIGIPRAMTSGLKIWPCVAIQIRASELFEQTPGPGAGEPLR